MYTIPQRIDIICGVIAEKTHRFVQARIGQLFLALVLVGPLTFIPTVWEAWTADNIDVLRTLTWPTMIIVNISAFLGVVHNGDWRMRLVMFIWVIMMVLIFLATLVR